MCSNPLASAGLRRVLIRFQSPIVIRPLSLLWTDASTTASTPATEKSSAYKDVLQSSSPRRVVPSSNPLPVLGSDLTIEPALDSGIYSSISASASASWMDTTKASETTRHVLTVGTIVPLIALLTHGGNPSIILPIQRSGK